uniref:Mitochondrial carrier protein n=1 Tax=Eucampia antarctica TaxID=49252 RepID=A0A7S2SIM3_9STRA|mmetsp:Transcript_8424/g.7975  ORF Transcript_8424/g.7975 Transcript_8424/m.7975 type:complete len:336 (+) Transcript_8424:1-1008(+)|eukprot:CAMPEP_0197833168 /NCGR_PEP_ID=MMETSP1437-20131217/18070_1 /TAXON_ID=49252 ORGANISM="Eucampia antarctica, Strain CCMP1452" /NCGR_SAMPLE_ID=MMETSP1437 /ASSEMBLY_ACC=CAM_ASM_001096 /LENGTH=335 /DNA_ID=CAMNT_0043437051 /DNA_START=131 /DNA_END=1138 /DNA_ORIENTATION=-
MKLVFILYSAICVAFVSGRSNSAIIHRGGARGSGKASTIPSLSTTDGPLETFVKTIKDARRHLAAAAVARATSIFTMYPMDTMKTRIQMEQPNALRLKGLYSGVGGSLVGQVPYGVLTFGSYEVYKNTLLEKFPDVRPVFLYAISAVLGDVTGSGWLCPSEVVKQKMQAGMYSTTGEAIREIIKKKGFGGFYEGYFGGLARDVPFRVAQLTSYEVSKKIFLQMKRKKQQQNEGESSSIENLRLSPGESAAVGAMAGSFSAAITSPLDRIKTLLMTDSAAYGGSVASCAAKIWREEGIAGFCQGLVPRVIYIAPSVMIFFIAYEQVQQRLLPSNSI